MPPLIRLVPAAIAALVLAASSGCAASPPAAPTTQPSSSILASSTPASGSTVGDSIESLKLHFDPPARLDEVTVTGPGGTMPMMVHAVGEVADYDLPLPSLKPGSYTVEWRAKSRGSEHEGRFDFTVR